MKIVVNRSKLIKINGNAGRKLPVETAQNQKHKSVQIAIPFIPQAKVHKSPTKSIKIYPV